MKRLDNDLVEVNTISDIYDKPEGSEDFVIVKENVKGKLTISLNLIKSVEYLIDKTAKVVKGKCEIYYDQKGPIILNEKYKVIRDAILPNKKTQIGFNYKNRV